MGIRELLAEIDAEHISLRTLIGRMAAEGSVTPQEAARFLLIQLKKPQTGNGWAPAWRVLRSHVWGTCYTGTSTEQEALYALERIADTGNLNEAPDWGEEFGALYTDIFGFTSDDVYMFFEEIGAPLSRDAPGEMPPDAPPDADLSAIADDRDGLMEQISALEARVRELSDLLDDANARIGELSVGASKLTFEHSTSELEILAEAAREWWSTYEAGSHTTAPKNDDVIAWLEKKGVAKRKAEIMASILRPTDIPTGPR
jgi:hypothetical protein